MHSQHKTHHLQAPQSATNPLSEHSLNQLGHMQRSAITGAMAEAAWRKEAVIGNAHSRTQAQRACVLQADPANAARAADADSGKVWPQCNHECGSGSPGIPHLADPRGHILCCRPAAT